ncbi:MAG: hypothetical protein V2A73_13945 [Pseudomonadota bacterium]
MPTYNPGESLSFVVQARIDTEQSQVIGLDGSSGYEAWPSGLLTDAAQLARAIALCQALRDRPRIQASIVPTFPVLGLERGIVVQLDEVAWHTWGNDLHISSNLRDDFLWRIEGFSVGARRSANGSWEPIAGQLELESLP